MKKTTVIQTQGQLEQASKKCVCTLSREPNKTANYGKGGIKAGQEPQAAESIADIAQTAEVVEDNFTEQTLASLSLPKQDDYIEPGSVSVLDQWSAQLLVSFDAGKRVEAARELGKLENRNALSSLFLALDDSQDIVCAQAAMAIADLSFQAGTEHMIPTTGSLAEQIGRETLPEVQELIPLLKDSSRRVRYAAVVALAKISQDEVMFETQSAFIHTLLKRSVPAPIYGSLSGFPVEDQLSILASLNGSQDVEAALEGLPHTLDQLQAMGSQPRQRLLEILDRQTH